MSITGYKAIAIAALVAALVTGSLGGSASAQNRDTQAAQPNRAVKTEGMVQAVTQSGITLNTRRGVVTANVDAGTWIVVVEQGRCVEGSLEDIEVNRPVAVAGVTTGTAGTITARVIAQGRCGLAGKRPVAKTAHRLAKHAAEGTITAVNGSTITLNPTRPTRREVTVNTTAETLVFNNGLIQVSSLKVGDKVRVLGKPQRPAAGNGNSGRALEAWGISVDNGTTRMFIGRVTAISGNTITLKTPAVRNGLSVTVDQSTAYRTVTLQVAEHSVSAATLADVKVGSNLIVEGAQSGDGKAASAKAVVILPQPNAKQGRHSRP